MPSLLPLLCASTIFYCSGMDKVDGITRGEPPANPTRIVQASLASQNKAPPATSAPAPGAEITADMLNNAASGSDE